LPVSAGTTNAFATNVPCVASTDTIVPATAAWGVGGASANRARAGFCTSVVIGSLGEPLNLASNVCPGARSATFASSSLTLISVFASVVIVTWVVAGAEVGLSLAS
jgi:hypothetical protein